MKKLKKHTLYEVYNEWKADSVLIDHKPTEEDIQDLIKSQGWSYEQRSYISVGKVNKIYTK